MWTICNLVTKLKANTSMFLFSAAERTEIATEAAKFKDSLLMLAASMTR